MASVEVYNDLKATLQTQLSPVPVLDFDSIDPDQEQSEVAFIALEELVEDEALTAFGGNLCYTESGVIAVHHFVDAPESSAAARTFAENTQNLLRSQTLAGGTRIFEIDPPAPASANNGLWTVYTVAVTYELDTVRPHPAPLP